MIIKSILDNDLYKFSMSYAYMKLFPEAEGEFKFTDRDNTTYTEAFLSNLNQELDSLSSLSLTEKEFEALQKSTVSRYIPEFYWEWLKGWKPDREKIKVSLDSKGQLEITVTDKLYRATWYEVPILAIVSELRNKMLGYKADLKEVLKKLDQKIKLSNKWSLKFSEFGTRRRFSQIIQELVVKRLKESSSYCVGTSNVYLALKYNMTPIGTMAHEFISFHAAMYGYRQANYISMDNWSKVYGGDLGIMLTDTFGNKPFFRELSKQQAKLFDGVRHDSGDPFQYINLTCDRYKELGINPESKTIVFSNALTMTKFKEIAMSCSGRIQCSAGIGTNLTNDTGNRPSNIVMKLKRARMNSRKDWIDCIKISDEPGKHSGNLEEVNIARHQLRLE